ncbi:MAG TPA: Na/Pi symporter [Vicinamibacteria bacterium]|nr:Na/Pi symporter [Vicinamibacteria bacterium]
MLVVLASLLAGLGLFFVGLNLLTENLKLLSGRRLRENIAELTLSPLLGVLWGGVFITITQSAAAATFILIGTLRAGMMRVRQIFPILVGINMFGGVMVLVLIFDIKLAVFLLLGLAGLFYSSERAGSLRTVAGVAFGVGMLFLGLNTTQAGVAPLADMTWFTGALEYTRVSVMIGFVIGAILSFVVQSALAVVVLAIAFLQAGVFSLEQSIMIAYGSKLGSAGLTMALASGLTGESKQVATFQAGFNLLGELILVPAFCLETFYGVPLTAALAARFTDSMEMQLGIVNLLFNIVPGVIVLATLSVWGGLLARIYPPTVEEQASKPKYLYERATDDPHSALGLIELEQLRLIEILSKSFDAMRPGGDRLRRSALYDAFQALAAEIREAISEVSQRHRLAAEVYDRLNGVMKLQHGLETADGELHGLAEALDKIGGGSRGKRFARVAIDGLDAILLTLLDVGRERSEVDMELLAKMTSEDGMTRVRKAYLTEDSGLEPETRMHLLAAANHCERLIWLFGDLGRPYRALSTT